MEGKVFWKVVNRKKRGEARKGQEGKKNRWEKYFHSLRIPPLAHTRTNAALECYDLPLQARLLNCYFQVPTYIMLEIIV